jgi:hypothetical protein
MKLFHDSISEDTRESFYLLLLHTFGIGNEYNDTIINTNEHIKNILIYGRINNFSKFDTVGPNQIKVPNLKTNIDLVKDSLSMATKMTVMHLVTGQLAKTNMVQGTMDLVETLYDATEIKIT